MAGICCNLTYYNMYVYYCILFNKEVGIDAVSKYDEKKNHEVLTALHYKPLYSINHNTLTYIGLLLLGCLNQKVGSISVFI